MPVVTAIHTAGAVAFARPCDNTSFDVRRIRQSDYGLSYCQERVDTVPKTNLDPLEAEAHRRVTGELRHKNRKLGVELTRLNNRFSYGDIAIRMNATTMALEWAMREKIRREIGGEISPWHGPRLVRIRIDNVGEWLWRRSDDGYGWKLLTTPLDPITEIHIP